MGHFDSDDEVGAVHSQAATQLRSDSLPQWEEDDDNHHSSSDQDDEANHITTSIPSPPSPATSPSPPAAADDDAALLADPDPTTSETVGVAPSSAPLKRPPSSYFLFCAEQRTSARAEAGVGGVAAVAKVLGARWKALTADERQPYDTKAKQAKADYQLALQQQPAHPKSRPTTFSTNPDPSSTSSSFLPSSLFLPPSLIKRLLQLDPSIKRTSKEAALALSRTTELFLALLVGQCAKVAAGRKRRRLMVDDVLAVAEGVGGMEFLRADLRQMKKEMEQQREAQRKEREEQIKETEDEEKAQTAEGQEVDGEDGEEEKENRPVGGEEEGVEGEEEQKESAVEKKGRGRKGKKDAMDMRQYPSLASMFSRMTDGAEQRRKGRVEQMEDGAEDGEVEELLVSEVEQEVPEAGGGEVDEVEEDVVVEEEEEEEEEEVVAVHRGGRGGRASPKRRRVALAAAEDIDSDDGGS